MHLVSYVFYIDYNSIVAMSTLAECDLISILFLRLWTHGGRLEKVATKSILKEVNFKKPKLISQFVTVLENAEKDHGKEVVLSKPTCDLKGEKIREMFGNK